MSESEERYQQIKKVTIIGLVTNIFLAFSKTLLGFIGQSQALIADGVHSMADLISDLIVLVAAKQASRQADEEHPYGHGRFETVAEVALGSFLVAVAAGILIDALSRIYEPQRLLSPTWFALVAAGISILANEGLFQYTIRIAKKLKSTLLTANAWHHRSDAISSIIALVGITGAMMGFPMLDAVAAIGVSLLIAKVGWDITWRSLRELVDTALAPEKVQEIKNVILSVNGVKAVHSLRTRSVGSNALVDVHILVVNSRISVSEGHQISERVMRQLISEVEDVTDVTVHIDPEDDELNAPCGHLPLRGEVEAALSKLFEDNKYYKQVSQIELHYLDGKVFVVLILPIALAVNERQITEIAKSFSHFADVSYIAEISVKYM